MPHYLLHCQISPDDFNESWAKFFKQSGLIPEVYLREKNLAEEVKKTVEKVVHWAAGMPSRPTLHAPWISADPVLFDAAIRKHWGNIIDRVIPITSHLQPRIIVCHPIFDKYRTKKGHSKWIDENLRFFDYILRHTESLNNKIGIENIYDERPDSILELMERIGSERVAFCFDTGHFNKFSKVSLAKWFKVLGDRLCEIHVHDNFGKHDEHLPAGEGNFPFSEMVRLLADMDRELIMTIETPTMEDTTLSLERLRKLLGI